MPNDFEKQLQQQGDEFRLPPREWVWPRIEAELDKKKPRFAFWWWTSVIVLMSAGTWFYFAQTSETKHDAAQSIAKQLPGPSSSTTETKTSKSNAPADEPLSVTGNNTDQHKTHLKQTQPFNIIHSNEKTDAQHIDIEKDEIREENILAANSWGIKQEDEKESIPEAFNTIAESDSRLIGRMNINETALSGTNNMTTEIFPSLQAPFLCLPEDTCGMQKQTGLSTDGKLKWRLHIGIGFSNNADGKKLFELSNPNMFYDASVNNSGGGTVPRPQPLQPNSPAMCMSAAVYRSQPLSRRFEWRSGLAYQFQQMRQQAGSKKDSVFAANYANSQVESKAYYSGAQTETYKGVNHRIMLSTGMVYDLIHRRNKLKLITALQGGYNLYSRQLIPDYTNNRFIQTNDLFHQWMAGLCLGLEFVTNKQWSIGLLQRHDFTPSYTSNNKTYWRSTELNIGLPFKKRK